MSSVFCGNIKLMHLPDARVAIRFGALTWPHHAGVGPHHSVERLEAIVIA